MQADEYERRVAETALPAYVLAHQLLSAMRPNPLSDTDWLAFLQALYDTVRAQAWIAAGIAREFYDAERERQIPGAPVHPIDRAVLTFRNFVRDMESVRKTVSEPDFSPDVAALRAARSVENGARRTIMRAVEEPDQDLDPVIDSQEEPDEGPPPEVTDDQPRQLIRGWARVPTGRETCGFCWMLASRGPVFNTSWAAGARLKDSEIVRKTADGSMTSDDMNQWHTGCDCKVVPVYRLSQWPGKEKHEAAWELWKREIQGRYSGKDAINEYRKLVESGELQKILAARAA